MKDLVSYIDRWLDENKNFAIATVINTWGSSPRPVGSCMLISGEGEMVGSVSGGCVETDVIRETMPLLEDRQARLLQYGVSNEDAWSVGLTCGGKVDVYVQPFFAGEPDEDGLWSTFKHHGDAGKSFALVHHLVEKPGHALVTVEGKMSGTDLDVSVIDQAIAALGQRKSQLVEHEGNRYFIQVFPQKCQLIIIGAAHVTTALVRLGHMYDFETMVIDPRDIFRDKTQFDVPPDHLFAKYPSEVLPDLSLDSNTFAAILSHDPKIDDNALEILLRSPVAYIGALGSSRTHKKRVGRLREKGFSEEEINRIQSPIGVDIGARTAEEIALSIIGEVVKVRND